MLAGWKSKIGIAADPDAEERELLMTLSPAFIEWEQRTKQQGIERGIERGTRNERRLSLSSLLEARFGELDGELEAVIQTCLELSSEEFARQMPSLLSLSRDELASQFSRRAAGDET